MNINFIKENIIYIIFLFIFIKYGIKDINIVFFLLISIGIIYYLNINFKYTKQNKIEKLDNNIFEIFKKIEEFDKEIKNKTEEDLELFYDRITNKVSIYEKNDIDDLLFLKR